MLEHRVLNILGESDEQVTKKICIDNWYCIWPNQLHERDATDGAYRGSGKKH